MRSCSQLPVCPSVSASTSSRSVLRSASSARTRSVTSSLTTTAPVILPAPSRMGAAEFWIVRRWPSNVLMSISSSRLISPAAIARRDAHSSGPIAFPEASQKPSLLAYRSSPGRIRRPQIRLEAWLCSTTSPARSTTATPAHESSLRRKRYSLDHPGASPRVASAAVCSTRARSSGWTRSRHHPRWLSTSSRRYPKMDSRFSSQLSASFSRSRSQMASNATPASRSRAWLRSVEDPKEGFITDILVRKRNGLQDETHPGSHRSPNGKRRLAEASSKGGRSCSTLLLDVFARRSCSTVFSSQWPGAESNCRHADYQFFPLCSPFGNIGQHQTLRVTTSVLRPPLPAAVVLVVGALV